MNGRQLIEYDLANYAKEVGPEPPDPSDQDSYRRWREWWWGWFARPLRHPPKPSAEQP